MASNLLMFSTSDEHITFMSRNLGTVWDYYAGKIPQHAIDLPDGWPSSRPVVFDLGVNHRNSDLYHAILNKTLEPVEGAGSIFQTWFCKSHSAIALDDHHGAFAFPGSQLEGLLSLVRDLTPASVSASFQAWQVKTGKSRPQEFRDEDAVIRYEIYIKDNTKGLQREFDRFEGYLTNAIKNDLGLVWVAS